jgi:hypothetical protein
VRQVIEERLSRFVEIAESDSNPKMQGQAGVLLSVASSHVNFSFESCISIMNNFLRTENPILLKSAARMGRFLIDRSEVFDILSNFSLRIQDSSVLNAFLETCRRFVKAGCDGRRLAAAFNDRSTKIYRFLAAVKSPDIAPILTRWFSDAPSGMISAYVAAMSKVEFTRQSAAVWVQVLSRRMLSAGSYQKEVMIGLIMEVIREDQSVIDIDIFVSQLLMFLENETDLGLRAALGCGILELCSLGAEMDDDVIEEILAEYPWEPGFGKCEIATRALMKMMNMDVWNAVRPAVALCFCQMLTRSWKKQGEYGIDENLRSDMRSVVVDVFSGNEKIKVLTRGHLKESAIVLKRFDWLFP